MSNQHNLFFFLLIYTIVFTVTGNSCVAVYKDIHHIHNAKLQTQSI